MIYNLNNIKEILSYDKYRKIAEYVSNTYEHMEGLLSNGCLDDDSVDIIIGLLEEEIIKIVNGEVLFGTEVAMEGCFDGCCGLDNSNSNTDNSIQHGDCG